MTETPSESRAGSLPRVPLLGLAIAAGVLLVYWQVRNHAYVD